MAMEFDDFDYVNEVPFELDNTTIQNITEDKGEQEGNFEDMLLRERGISDRNKIKFENDYGDIEEVSWDSLSDKDKFDLISSSARTPESELEDDEIHLLNAIRLSQLSPRDYIEAIQNQSALRAQQDMYNQSMQFLVDLLSDDELYTMDFIARTEDATEAEVLEELERAKENPTLFNKLINALRNDYRSRENEELQQLQYQQRQQAQEQYNQFSDLIIGVLNNFNDFAGYDLNMNSEDKLEIFEFVTGFDSAGKNHLAKALQHPEVLTKAAWFILYGEDIIRDIDAYYRKEIANIRSSAKQRDTAQFVYKNKNTDRQPYDDLDLE